MEHATDITFCTMILAILFAAWNGLVIRWYNTREDVWRDWWHKAGLVIRLFVLLTLWLATYNVLWTVILALVLSLGYNVIINLVIGKPVWYVGTTSKIDKLIRKIFGKWL